MTWPDRGAGKAMGSTQAGNIGEWVEGQELRVEPTGSERPREVGEVEQGARTWKLSWPRCLTILKMMSVFDSHWQRRMSKPKAWFDVKWGMIDDEHLASDHDFEALSDIPTENWLTDLEAGLNRADEWSPDARYSLIFHHFEARNLQHFC